MVASSAPNNYDGQNLPNAYVLGPNWSPIDLVHKKGEVDYFVVVFHIGEFYRLFGTPGKIIKDNIIDFSLWDSRWAEDLIFVTEQLFFNKDPKDRKRIVEYFLRRICYEAEFQKCRRHNDLELFQFLIKTARDKGWKKINLIGDYAQSVWKSARTLNRIVKEFSGVTYKQLLQHFRMINLLSLLHRNKNLKKKDLIKILEYHNHYHLDKDFFEHTGELISSYKKENFDVGLMLLNEEYSVY